MRKVYFSKLLSGSYENVTQLEEEFLVEGEDKRNYCIDSV